MISHFILRSLLGIGVGFSVLCAQVDVPQKLDLAGVPADLVEEVVVPVPGEVFSALQHCGDQPWQEALFGQEQLDSITARTSRNHTAILFGLVVANGFLAVQAENQQAVQETGEKVLLLADVLGVKQDVLQHTQVIVENAEAGNWQLIRQELDRVEASVREALHDLADEEVAKLISIGGWLGGMDALLHLGQVNYSLQAAELLRQPDLAHSLQQQIQDFEQERREEEIVQVLEQTLAEVKELMQVEVPNEQTIADLRVLTSAALIQILATTN